MYFASSIYKYEAKVCKVHETQNWGISMPEAVGAACE